MGVGSAREQPNSNAATAHVDGLDRVCYQTGLALRRALETGTSRDREDAEVREHVRCFCAGARELGLQAEDVIIIVETSWRSLRAVSREDQDARSVLDDLVSHCIVEFDRPTNDESRP